MVLGDWCRCIGANFHKVGFVLFVGYGGCGAHATSVELAAPMEDFALFNPQYPPPPGPARPYAVSGPHPTWGIADWNLPGGALPEFHRESGSLVSLGSTATVKLTPTTHGVQITVTQDGSNLACVTDAGQPRELDMFISPNPTNVVLPGVSGLLTSSSSSPSIGQMRRLIARTRVSLTMGIAKRPKGCRTNLGSAIVSLILRNDEIKPVQVLFYQLVLGRLCGNNTRVPIKSCADQSAAPMIFSNRNAFGNDDYLPLLNEPWLLSTQSRMVVVDLLPRIIMMIQSRYDGGIDRNLSHWHVATMYIGQHIWGDVAFRSSWSDFHLVAETSD